MKEKIAETLAQVDRRDLRNPVIAVYAHPEDHPDHYAARIYDRDRPTDTVILKDSLEELQEDIRKNFPGVFFSRGAEDVPCLVGCWI